MKNKKQDKYYFVGEWARVLAFAMSKDMPEGEYFYIGKAEDLKQVPNGACLSLLCTADEYWSLEMFFHQKDFMDYFWEKDLWFNLIDVAES